MMVPDEALAVARLLITDVAEELLPNIDLAKRGVGAEKLITREPRTRSAATPLISFVLMLPHPLPVASRRSRFGVSTSTLST